eukprot:Phypoly_transcript_08333.p1 GENE.Phypoly_transcript_08333~~Phypoly_transcript_08333.p1  ORF type:complete len:441 (+),score=90.08 Phypoly_transcript_08333:130-1452(+)
MAQPDAVEGSEVIESEDPQVTIATLCSALEHEKLRSKTLQDEIKALRAEMVTMQAKSEQEDEYRVNKLSKHVEQIKKEKQDMMRQVEQEEEYITNTLVKKLEQVRREKVDLENQLEQEEEFITNKLQKQLLTVVNEKSKLEKKLESEVSDHHKLTKLESEASVLRSKLAALVQERNEYEKKNDAMKDQLLKLKTENFALAQRIKREQERFTQVNEDKLRLMSNIEMGDERRYNTRSAAAIGMRARSVSLPAEPQLPSSKFAPSPHQSPLKPTIPASPSSPPMHARSPPIHTLPHTTIPKTQGKELISAPVRIRDPNAHQRATGGPGSSLVGASSTRSYAALRDMGARVFLQLWRVEAAYLNHTQPHDLAIDLATVSDSALDKNDPRCLTLSFSNATASPNQKAAVDPTLVSRTIDALTLTFDKEEQAAEWFGLLKELSVC